MPHFRGDKSVTFAQARRGEVIVSQGHGSRPLIWRPSSGQFREAGVESPSTAPSIKLNEEDSFYVARVDILNGGSGWTKPPIISIEGGDAEEQAKAVSRINSGQVSAVEVTDHGRQYSDTPDVLVRGEGASGSGLRAEVVLWGEYPAPPSSGIVYWEPIQYIAGKVPFWRGAGTATGRGNDFEFVATTSKGAKLKVVPYQSDAGDIPSSTICGQEGVPEDFRNKFSPSKYLFLPEAGGRYAPGETVDVEVSYFGSRCKLIIRGYTVGTARVPDEETAYLLAAERGYAVKEIKVTNGGRGYKQPPAISILPYPDAPAYLGVPAEAEVNDLGVVTSISPPSPSRRFVGSPIVEATTADAETSLLAIMRATLRGRYQCYYRYVDDSVPVSAGGPIYTNLSPVHVVNAGNAAHSLEWEVPSAPDGMAIELWRSSSNQATTLYRVSKIGGTDSFGSFIDDLNDNELTDPNRDGFQALPILLPNGELNANRFGRPPDNFAVAVMFQDRLWMGVNTDNTQPNALRFSEMDEPESMPDVNEIIIQQNLRAADYVTALIPYAGALVVCQSRHCHRLTYVSQPLVDVGVFMLAYRGCLNQRCWDIYEGRAFLMDDQGVYSLDPQGKIEGLTIGIDDIWQTKIDWSKREWFSVRADRRLNVLRCFVSYKGDDGQYPTRSLCYSLDYKAWWEERYPTTLVGTTDCRSQTGQVSLLYGGTDRGIYRVGYGLTDHASGAVDSVTIVHGGRGYRRPPKITATGGTGAEFACALNADGSIAGIQIKHCGTGYPGGMLVIDPPEYAGEPATAEYTVRSGAGNPVHYSVKTGNMEFVTNYTSPKAEAAQNRQISLVYQPTQGSSILNLETYYNGASYPRSNVVRRDRGTGFVSSEEVPAATLDMAATPVQDAESHGVASAMFAGRTLDDVAGADRHIAAGLSGKQSDAGRVVIHSLDMYGVEAPGPT